MTCKEFIARGVLPRLAAASLVAALALDGRDARAAEPAWPGTTWATAAPAQVGMDAALLLQGVDFAKGYGGAGMVVRQGHVVATWGDTNALVNVRSVAKSFGSILAGVAVGDGLLALSDRAQDRLPSFGLPPQSNAATGWLPLVTLEQLATHTAGFAKDGGYVETNLAPGTAFRYSDGGSNWMGDVLTATFRQDLSTVLRARVLNPIGVPTSGLRWGVNTYRPEPIDGVTRRAINSTIYASADAMARVGLLLARGGQWRTTQVLPRDYVERAAKVPDSLIRLQPAADYEVSTPYPTQHYGLLFWNNADGAMPGLPTGSFWAWGLDDALIVAVPSLDLVVVRHGPRIDPGTNGVRFGSYAAIKPFLAPIGRSVTRANATPVVDAGPDLTLPGPGSLQIVGRFADDGLPGQYSPTVRWTRSSGPATVTFAPANRAVTTATFTVAGTYQLMLEVNDRELKRSNTVKVVVKP